MFFEKFPLLLYTLDNNRTVQTVPDILRRAVLSNELKNNSSVFDQYDIKDGETPEIVADYWYGDSNLHWVILIANDIIDPRFDWPMSYYNLVEFVKGKYGEEDVNSLHHYVNPQEYIVSGYRAMVENSSYTLPQSIQFQATTGVQQINLVLQNFPTGSLFPVTNLMYETAENEKKRRINILKPEIVSTVETNFNTIIQQ
jgi:hypothetical protein